jgi:predicted dehydrogenase
MIKNETKNEAMNATMPRVLIAGLGSIGRRHLHNLLSLGVTDIQLLRTKSEQLDEAPTLTVHTSLEKALASQPDVILICNPTAHHMDIAIPAASAGCNIFIEKPLSHTWEQVDSLLEIAREKDLVGLVGFDLHFDPGLRKVRQLIAAGVIGHVTSLQAQVGQYLPDWHPWENYRTGVSASVKMGGGVVLDLIHELDYVRWLMGNAQEIGCMSGKVSSLEIETEDTASIMLRFASGAIGTINLDYVQRTLSRSCRVVGEEGTIAWNLVAQRVSWFTAENKEWSEFSYAGFERNDRFVAEMKHLLACLERQEQPEVDLEDGSRVLKLALLAKQANRTGKVLKVEYAY